MKIVSRIFLTAFVISLVLSFIKPASEFLGGILKPAATIFFMLFFITMVFGKIIRRYDEEQDSKRGAAESGSSASSQDSRQKPALTSALHHD
jgi:hypothetical protein